MMQLDIFAYSSIYPFRSDMAADASSRKEFIDWNIDQISKYGTDGVDIGNINIEAVAFF
jgi:hypothetical protein